MLDVFFLKIKYLTKDTAAKIKIIIEKEYFTKNKKTPETIKDTSAIAKE